MVTLFRGHWLVAANAESQQLVDVGLNWRRALAQHAIVCVIGNVDSKFTAGLGQLLSYRDVLNASEYCALQSGQ